MFFLCHIISNQAQSKRGGIQLSKYLSCTIKKNKKHQHIINEQQSDGEKTEDIQPDFAEGLKRMLASLYGHTSNNVLSSTMSTKLLADGERFNFSHDFMSIPLKHMIQWLHGEENLEFKLRKVKIDEGVYEHVQDMFINYIGL